MTDILNRRFAPSDDAAESAVGDETVILHLANGTYYGLDPVGTLVWSMLKERQAPAAICCRIANDFEMDLPTVEADIRRFLSDLAAQDIIIDA